VRNEEIENKLNELRAMGFKINEMMPDTTITPPPLQQEDE
jgi:hypothetical protein